VNTKRISLVSVLFMAAQLLSARVVVASDSLDLMLGATTNYVFRGISQTDNKAAGYAGFDYSHSSGPYFGLWTSRVNFPTVDGRADAELDIYGGIAGEIRSLGNLGWDLGYILYRYNQTPPRYDEAYLSLSFDLVPRRLKATIKGSYETEGDQVVGEGLVTLDAGSGLFVKLQPGHVDDRSTDNNDYKYVKVAASKSVDVNSAGIRTIDIELAYSDTSLKRGDASPYGVINDRNEDRVHDLWYLSVTAHF